MALTASTIPATRKSWKSDFLSCLSSSDSIRMFQSTTKTASRGSVRAGGGCQIRTVASAPPCEIGGPEGTGPTRSRDWGKAGGNGHRPRRLRVADATDIE